MLAVAENDRVVDLVQQGMVTRMRQDQTLAAVETARQQMASAEANVQRARAALAQARAGRENLTVLGRSTCARRKSSAITRWPIFGAAKWWCIPTRHTC